MKKFDIGDLVTHKSLDIPGVITDEEYSQYLKKWLYRVNFDILKIQVTDDEIRYTEQSLTFDGIPPLDYAMGNEPTQTKRCLHQFVRYNGFSETYLYCKLCDLKKENQ